MGHTRREVRAMQEDAVRPPHTAATVGYGVIKFQVLGFQLLFRQVR
jgi:hypothetical protein